MFKRVVIVCTGNICRSPYAEVVLARAAPHLIVSSAGLDAVLGHGAEETGIRVSASRGYSLDQHQPQQMRSPIVASSDLILVMDDEHLDTLIRRYPEARGKAFKLGKWLGNKDIVDPYLRGEDFFGLVFDEIERAITAWLVHLQ
jgi:protein-tyrosine phosphatase